MIVYLAADLLWGTRIKAEAESLGATARPVRNPDMLSARFSEGRITGFLVDTETGETALQLIVLLRELERAAGVPPATIIAFGPHVAVDALSAARSAGADRSMPRGALAARLGGVLQELSGGALPR